MCRARAVVVIIMNWRMTDKMTGWICIVGQTRNQTQELSRGRAIRDWWRHEWGWVRETYALGKGM